VLSHRERPDRVRSVVRTCEENPHGQIPFEAARAAGRCGRGSARPSQRGASGALGATRSGDGSRWCPSAAARCSAGGLLLRHQSWAMQRRAPDPTARYRFVAALVWRGAVAPPREMPHGGTRVGLDPSCFGGVPRERAPSYPSCNWRRDVRPVFFFSVAAPLSFIYPYTIAGFSTGRQMFSGKRRVSMLVFSYGADHKPVSPNKNARGTWSFPGTVRAVTQPTRPRPRPGPGTDNGSPAFDGHRPAPGA
jgi:hypothetical protein